ncbi:polymorphic toxin-type HINT domain-containing protein [Actinoplanes sp. NPDC048988]|uniref:polymorphic toxin-type HINT domain-containing protein n=1 Tax=Actinoplanes sp. NPDC048988 TaxID=3363901 RepID=UPI00371F8CD2
MAVPDPARAVEPEETPVDRARVAALWMNGGPMVKPAAEAALLGSDDDVRAFVGRLEDLQSVDERVLALGIYSGGGPAVRAAALKALDTDTIETFLQTGWQESLHTDQRVRVQQVIAAGGPQLKAAGTAALDADTASPLPALNMTDEPEGPLDEFLRTGWRDADELDKRIRVSQIYAKAVTGSNVRRMAQRALDDGSADALAGFIDSGYAVAAAWDEEAAAVTDLAAAAETASAEARNQNERAQEAADQARKAGAEAKKSAEAALAAMDSAGDNLTKAADAANRAASAAEQAAKTAQKALAASDAAVMAARAAAAAAARAMTQASLARRAANRANKAAADAAVDKKNAANATKMATAADLAAKAAEDSVGFLQSALILSTSASIGWAQQAEADATIAIQAAESALAKAKQVGVNVAAAEAAAKRAHAQADRARRAANATRKYAAVAVEAANTAIDAATKAAADARAAADRALDAVAHAGDATRAAQTSTDAANAAVRSAEASVSAATKAYDIYAAGRAADAERIAVVDSQGAAAAKAGLAIYEHYEQSAAWNAREAAKRDARTNELIAQVRSPLTARPEAVVAARRVAMALATGSGPHTSESARAALGDTDDEVLDFVRTGIDVAAAVDDRATVTAMAYDKNPNLAAAALKALEGTDADVALFLRDQNYPERATDDRVAVGRILAKAQNDNNVVTVREATKALDGDEAAVRAFVESGQYDAARTDARVNVNKLLAQTSPGTNLYAAARNALDGPPGMLQDFLNSGRHAAAQADYDTARHDQEMQALLARAISAAWIATQNAQEAQSVAAKARGSANEANAWAAKAITSGTTAIGHATKAAEWAGKAETSAKNAISSADTATAAAERAEAAAADATRSVAVAHAAFASAQDSAGEAIGAARRARDAAIAAGQEANAAIGVYNAMVKRVNDRQKKIEQAHIEALQEQFRECLRDAGPIPEKMGRCLQVYEPTDMKIARASENRKFCDLMDPSGSDYHRKCVADTFNPMFGSNRAFDMIESEMLYVQAGSIAVGGMTAMVTLALGCAALCAAGAAVLGGAEVSMGVGGLFGVWIEEQAIAWAAGSALTMVGGARLINELKGSIGRIRVPAALERVGLPAKILESNFARMVVGGLTCKGNSFTADTPVLMADGSSRAIAAVRVGDRVLATDPGTGRTEPRAVTDLIAGSGAKDLVDVSTAGGTVTATVNHPFWVADPGEWRDAGTLAPGQWLRTSSGTWVQITAVRPHTAVTTVHNLTVDGLHSYYVQAGATSLLVHNDVPCLKPLALGYKKFGVYDWARKLRYDHFEGNGNWQDEVNVRLRASGAPPINVLMSGFEGGLTSQIGPFDQFLTMAFKGAKPLRIEDVPPERYHLYADATQAEMFAMVKAFYDFSKGGVGREPWKNIKFFTNETDVAAPFPTIDWWNAVKLYGKGDQTMINQLNHKWKSKLDGARYDLELEAGTV